MPRKTEASTVESDMAPWELVETETMAKFGVYEVVRERRRNPRDGRTHSFAVQISRDWAMVIPLTEAGTIVLVRQYRPGTSEVTWEFPGGVIEPGEDPADAVARELTEETGFASRDVVKVASFRPNPALIRNTLHVFFARNCIQTGSTDFDDSEDLDTWHATPEEVDDLVETGGMNHVMMVAAWLSAKRSGLV